MYKDPDSDNPKKTPTPTGRRVSTRREDTRNRLLDATIRLIADGGLKAVSHREVARAASLSPTITTHYFSSRTDMIEQAFQRFRERGARDREATWKACMKLLDDPALTSDRATLTGSLADLATEYVCRASEERSERLAFEMAFLFEPRLEPELVNAVQSHVRSIREPAIAFCHRFGCRDPQTDAGILVGAMLRLQYERLAITSNITRLDVRATVYRLLSALSA